MTELTKSLIALVLALPAAFVVMALLGLLVENYITMMGWDIGAG